MFKSSTFKSLLINLFIVIILCVVVVFACLKFIDSYTHHGETISVPPLEGLTLKEVENTLTAKKLRFSILDSIYKEKKQKGVVLEQDPLANSLVKENRTIYITISKTVAPKVTMPDVIDKSQRMAIAKLKSYNFNIKNILFKPSEHEGVVLGVKIGDKEITAGDKINESSNIILIVGSGKGNVKIMVPYLINLTKEEAITELQQSSLSLGAEIYNETCNTKEDTLNARVYQQYPVRSKNVAVYIGSSIDLYFTCDTAQINYAPPIDSLTTDSTNTLK